MFSSSGLLPTVVGLGRTGFKKLRKGVIPRKKSTAQKLTECIGHAMSLGMRHYHEAAHLPSPYGYACSLRCRHPMHLKDRNSSSRGKSEDFIPEHLYRKYTETDSRPLSPELTRRSASVPRVESVSKDRRRCVTPEPETRQCQFHHRRVLVLDLRRVKSVDAIGRQGSRTPGTSIDSTGDDADAASSMLFQFSPRHSVSRSITPKTKQRGRGGKRKKFKERSTSPIAYERSSSPKILEGLTLPPLHSSVLTLLGGGGQRSTARGGGAGGGGLPYHHQDNFSSGPLKHKKLRRHGRSRKTEKQNGENENLRQSENRAGSEEVKKLEDPNETQISAILGNDEDDFGQTQEQMEESLEDLKQNMTVFKQSRQALYSVLDDYLAGKVWSPQQLSTLDQQIQGITQEFQKFETKFQTQNIQLKESTWLSFPRTWSRNSATFSAPSDTKSLKEMKPLDYLKHFVTVSGPRKHLYNLVFQRYRTMENPTKDWIWVKTLQPALSEILGRQFREDEMVKLCHHYLGEEIEKSEQQISELGFSGICAFCERIFADYSLEDNDECHKCSKIPNKQDCHKNKNNPLEKADLTYLFSKLRDGLVQKHLGNLFLALCNKD